MGAGAPSTGLEPLTALLAARTTQRSTAAERRGWLVAAANIVDRRVDSVVSNKNREEYRRVAELVIAHAEALTIDGRGVQGASYIAGTRERYPRHSAFRAELDGAADESTLLAGRTGRSSQRPRGRS